MGNRPGMLLKSSDAKSLSFDFDPTCGINPSTESHMHALTITFDNPDTITTSCQAFINGKETEAHPTTLKREKVVIGGDEQSGFSDARSVLRERAGFSLIFLSMALSAVTLGPH